MKLAKHNAVVGIVCLAIALLGLFLLAPVSKYRISDLHFRHNEISCSHTGINPFLIWNHQITSDTYQALAHPENNLFGSSEALTAEPETVSHKLRVHAYPAWHTTFFWFYGWLSQKQCDILMYLLYAIITVAFFIYLRRWQPEKPGERLLFWGVMLLLLRASFLECFYYGNYGIVLLLASVLLYESLERKWHCRAGFLWALMMIKPNVSMLLFWPLLFQKRYLTIAVAISVCLLATLWPAYVYRCSPVELILQIPAQGLPYIPRNSLSGIAYRLLGMNGIRLWMGGCFVLCGILSYSLRQTSSWMLRLLPAVLMASVWTYSKEYDRTIMWFFYLIVLQELLEQGTLRLSARGKKALWGYVMFCMGSISVSTVWEFMTKWQRIEPPRLEWLPKLLSYLNLFWAMCLLLLFALTSLRQQWQSKQQNKMAI